jgi:hypothetical protein
MVDRSKHPHGKSVKVMSEGDPKTLKVDYEFLDKVLLHPEVKDRSIVMFSIVGALREGKSFFLDYCLRFLYAHVSRGDNHALKPKTFLAKNSQNFSFGEIFLAWAIV